MNIFTGAEGELINTAEVSLGEQQRLVDYSITEDSLLPITEGTPEPTMSEGISSDWNKRLESMDESRRDRESGEISLLRSTVNTAGALAGGAFDIGGRLIEESVDTYLGNLKSFAPTTYNKVADKVTEAKEWALTTDAGKAAVEAAQAGYEEYSAWKEANPQDAKTFEAVLNIGMFGWGAKGVSSQVKKLFDKPTVNTVDDIVPEKPVLPPVATKKKGPVRDKEAEDTELTTLAEGLTESGGFKYKLPSLMLDETGKYKSGHWKNTLKGWVNKGLVKQEEIDDLRIQKYLDTTEGKISTKDIFSFMKENSPMLKTYSSKLTNKKDDGWLRKQPLWQEVTKLRDSYHTADNLVTMAFSPEYIKVLSDTNKEKVGSVSSWTQHVMKEDLIGSPAGHSLGDAFMLKFIESDYLQSRIKNSMSESTSLEDLSDMNLDLSDMNFLSDVAEGLLDTTISNRNEIIKAVVLEPLRKAYAKADGEERGVLDIMDRELQSVLKAKASLSEFESNNQLKLGRLNAEAMKRDTGDVSPTAWSNHALPNTKSKPITILIQSKVGTKDRLKELRDFHKAVSDARTGTMLGEGIPSLEHRISIKEKSRNQGGLSTSDTKRLIKDRLSLKKQLAAFKEKTGVAWEYRQAYIDKNEVDVYEEPHWTGVYEVSPLKKGIPQENIIAHLRGNVIEQSSLGEGKGFFVGEQQAQPHQTAMANVRFFNELAEIAPEFKGTSGYAEQGSGTKVAKLLKKTRDIDKAMSKLWSNVDVPAHRALEDPEFKRISKITGPMLQEQADIDIELKRLVGTPSATGLGQIAGEAIPDTLSHKKDWTSLTMRGALQYAFDNKLNYLAFPIEKHTMKRIQDWGDTEFDSMTAAINRNSIYSPRAYKNIVGKWDKDAKPFEDEYLDKDRQGDWTEEDIHKVMVFPLTKAIREGIIRDGFNAYRRGGLVTQMKALIPND